MHRAGECTCTPVSRAPARFGWDVEITGGELLGAFLKLKERTKPKPLITGREVASLGVGEGKEEEAWTEEGRGTGRPCGTFSVSLWGQQRMESRQVALASCPQSQGEGVSAHSPRTTDAGAVTLPPTSRFDFHLCLFVE